MKLLSIAIPCYNSQDYMRHAIETLLAGGEDVEILVVNDGAKDKTADIAAEYQQKYPTIVRAINKENGGHGDAVMTGLKNATGLYFKVVDSDDWVDEACLKRVLAQLRAFTEQKEEIDMLICNYVYDKVGVKHKHVMQYRRAVPQNAVRGDHFPRRQQDNIPADDLGNRDLKHADRTPDAAGCAVSLLRKSCKRPLR